MKNSAKNWSSEDSYSASDAATLLGVSIPTLKRMAKDGTLEGFRTPGGHLRVTAESIEAVKKNREPRPRTAREPSPVLQNRRERIEELALEAQEHRAKREIDKLRREEQEEAERREAEAQAREEEAEQRRAEIELERERLEREKAEDRRRRQREQAEEQARIEAEQELAAFRARWYDAAAQAVTNSPRLNWLTATQRKELIETIEAEIERREPGDQPRMLEIIGRTLQAAVEPLQAARDAQERRQRLTEEALRSLPWSATEAEKVKATAAIRDALQQFDHFADMSEMRVAAQEAVKPMRQAIERRLLDAKLLSWAICELPFWSRNEQDEARVRRECTEILAELPIDVSEAEGKEALRATVNEARREIAHRQAERDRQAKKARLVAEGMAEVVGHMAELERNGEITREEYWDSDFTDHLRTAVRCGLESGLTGDETTQEARAVARAIIDGELE